MNNNNSTFADIEESQWSIAISEFFGFLLGSSNTPWLASLWSLVFFISLGFAWVDAVVETSRCIAEFRRKRGQALTEHDKLGKYAPFNWFDRGQGYRRHLTVKFFEVLVRIGMILFMGIINGIFGMVVLFSIWIPAFVLWILKKFEMAGKNYEEKTKEYDSEDESEEESEEEK